MNYATYEELEPEFVPEIGQVDPSELMYIYFCSRTHFLYTLKYRNVCVIMIPYNMRLRTTPTKIGPYLGRVFLRE